MLPSPYAQELFAAGRKRRGTIERGDIDPSFIITHRIGLEDAPAMYRTFRDKDDECIKVVMKPGTQSASAM